MSSPENGRARDSLGDAWVVAAERKLQRARYRLLKRSDQTK